MKKILNNWSKEVSVTNIHNNDTSTVYKSSNGVRVSISSITLYRDYLSWEIETNNVLFSIIFNETVNVEDYLKHFKVINKDKVIKLYKLFINMKEVESVLLSVST